MRYIKLTVILCTALILQSCSVNAGAGGTKSTEPQSGILRQIPRQVASRLGLDVSKLPAALRPDAEALLSTGDEGEKRRLIERIGDSTSDSVRTFFIDLLD